VLPERKPPCNLPEHFAEDRPEQLHALMRAYPLAALVMHIGRRAGMPQSHSLEAWQSRAPTACCKAIYRPPANIGAADHRRRARVLIFQGRNG